MQNVNSVTILGNLGQDCSLRFTKNEKPVTNLRVATTEKYRDEAGNQQERTEWHRVTVWGNLAEACVNNLHKGSPVYIEGRLQTKQVERDGIKTFVTDVIASKVIFVEHGKNLSEGTSRANPSDKDKNEDFNDTELDDQTDDLF